MAKAKTRSVKYVYFFGNGKADGKAGMKNLLGGKGANLAEMTNLGVPVPPGFSISTQVCTYYDQNKHRYPAGLKDNVNKALAKVEKIMGAKFGDSDNPLLFSVRSGARVSMPGMMDTVLNLGMNDATVHGVIKQFGNERFGWDCYRRFIQMYGSVVMGLEHDSFEHALAALKKKRRVTQDTELDAADLEKLVGIYKTIVKKEAGKNFPQSADAQLWGAISAVFGSWNNPRAITYRKLNDIPGEWGTAVNVQTMVFGNMNDRCATGVAFTRDPSTGERKFFGEYLVNAQGEDVVAGIRTPQHINKTRGFTNSLEELMPKVYRQLTSIYKKLEKHYRDMQDIEFTIQNGTLWMLQTRTGKRTAAAAVRIAVEMVKEKLIDQKTAVLRVAPEQLDQLLHPMIDPKVKNNALAKGLPASPGAATGKVVFTADEAEARAKEGEDIILARVETSPDDIHGMAAANGILTSRGGMTSHAAVVARGMGKCCVAGCGDMVVDYAKNQFRVGKTIIKRNDFITLNGTTGEIIVGKVPLIEPKISGDFEKLMKWADEIRQINVRTNADTPYDASNAIKFGAEGIGLCRTEHMFFAEERLPIVQEMIMAKTTEKRQKAVDKLLPMQRKDFEGIFKAMGEHPVTIRLLDPPLHEFLPNREELMVEIAVMKCKKASAAKIARKEKILEIVESLHEFNPMLGHRGCRLGITYPEINKMQVTAIMQAAVKMYKKGMKIVPEIMIPLISHVNELKEAKSHALEAAENVLQKAGIKMKYMIGTMIEIPRAAITADKIAAEAEFFSFGTNDLTQMTFGLSRDDAGKFLPFYQETGILDKDPFQAIDQDGVGQMMKIAIEKGRSVRKDLKLGICGEHGGEPSSVIFCHDIGLDYVSCSPFRVPIARLAAAHAAINNPRKVAKKKSTKASKKKRR